MQNQVDERLPRRDLCGEETARFININWAVDLEQTAWCGRDAHHKPRWIGRKMVYTTWGCCRGDLGGS